MIAKCLPDATCARIWYGTVNPTHIFSKNIGRDQSNVYSVIKATKRLCYLAIFKSVAQIADNFKK